MSELFEGLFEGLGEAVSAVAELAVEGASAVIEGTTTVASTVAEGSAAGDGVASTMIDVVGEAADVGFLDTGSASRSAAQPAREKAKGGKPRRVRKGHRRLKSGGETGREPPNDAR